MAVAAALALLACAARPDGGSQTSAAAMGAGAANDQAGAIDRELARVRAATSAFNALDAAVAAGYRRDGGACIDNPPAGAMGYHHQNDALMDDRIDVERPEMLVYERLPDGAYRLNGVEYIVPLSVWPQTRDAPTVMGQKLKPSPDLNIWYLHVWVWTENPSGLFADWNPRVTCERRAGRSLP
jgi:hypothetical protein